MTNNGELNMLEQLTERDAPPISHLLRTYLNSLLKPYEDALSQAEDTESIMTWVQQVLNDELYEKFSQTINPEDTPDDLKLTFLSVLMDALLEGAAKGISYKQITIWDVTKYRDETLTKLFGEGSDTIPVKVTVGQNEFIHDLTQDHLFGILTLVKDIPEYSFSVNDVPVTFDDISEPYLILPEDPQDERRIYHATLTVGPVSFITPDVIRGVITAAEWLKLDPKTYVVDLTERVDGKMVPILF